MLWFIDFLDHVGMANTIGFKATRVLLCLVLVTELFIGLRLKKGREESFEMRSCVSGYLNSAIFLHYLSKARSMIIHIFYLVWARSFILEKLLSL